MAHTPHWGLLALAALALSLGSAQAQPDPGTRACGKGDQGCARAAQRDGMRQGMGAGRDNDRRPRAGWQRPDGERGAGPDHALHRGERLPGYYRSNQYVVDDWRGHGLRAPPRGYHWVQTGADYVLVAISTGIILELLLDR